MIRCHFRSIFLITIIFAAIFPSLTASKFSVFVFHDCFHPIPAIPVNLILKDKFNNEIIRITEWNGNATILLNDLFDNIYHHHHTHDFYNDAIVSMTVNSPLMTGHKSHYSQSKVSFPLSSLISNTNNPPVIYIKLTKMSELGLLKNYANFMRMLSLLDCRIFVIITVISAAIGAKVWHRSESVVTATSINNDRITNVTNQLAQLTTSASQPPLKENENIGQRSHENSAIVDSFDNSSLPIIRETFMWRIGNVPIIHSQFQS